MTATKLFAREGAMEDFPTTDGRGSKEKGCMVGLGEWASSCFSDVSVWIQSSTQNLWSEPLNTSFDAIKGRET
ncbi:MAG TPA: hypothetical protein VGC79_14620 [Polyangiaceae bacterium]